MVKDVVNQVVSRFDGDLMLNIQVALQWMVMEKGKSKNANLVVTLLAVELDLILFIRD